MPTIKQKKAFKALGENGGNISKAMATAGYAPSITHATEKLTNSQGWAELMDEYLPESTLAEVHQKGLEANKVISANITYGDADEKTTDFIDVPDWQNRSKFLDMAYKLRGSYAPEKHQSENLNIQTTISSEIVAEILDKLKKKKLNG